MAVLTVIVLDPNLTSHIVLNAAINATLNPSPSNLIKDWLPSITAIIVVIAGGLITYFNTIKIEMAKRQYELKKEVYFNAINKIIKLRLLLPLDENDPEYAKKFLNFKTDVNLLQMSIKISASNEVVEAFDLIADGVDKAPNYGMFIDIIYKKLIPAMRKDLLESETKANQWWQFWK